MVLNNDKNSKNEMPLNVADFESRIVESYNAGTADEGLPADVGTARSLIPAGTARMRDFSYIAPELPLFDAARCVGCMECVTECPDTAILGKVLPQKTLSQEIAKATNGDAKTVERHFAKTNKYFNAYQNKGKEPGLFGIFIDPTKCKGCGECVEVCSEHAALKMIQKTPAILEEARTAIHFFFHSPETPSEYINEKLLSDMMLSGKALLYVGGAGSCMGCGEGTAIRMMVAATGFVYGKENLGIVASTGCNTVYSSTYPYNPFLVPWMNSLFENSPAVAMGVRARWNQEGHSGRRLWTIGGDGAMYDIGFQSLSRMLVSGMDIKTLVLDTQVYSNTGGQVSTSSFLGQDAKMSVIGKVIKGKTENRKEFGLLTLMHGDVYVAQTTPHHINHFYRSILDANSFEGPAVVVVYTTCQPEHGVADNMASHQAQLAVDTRTYPLFTHDPRKGASFQERLSLQGNPAQKEDWATDPKTGQPLDFITFARSEGRFAKHFDADGKPSEALLAAKESRLKFWRQLQELAGVRRGKV